MKFTVTALGSRQGGEAAAAGRIVEYLLGRVRDPNRPLVGLFGVSTERAGAIGRYYRADQLEGAGWWGGQGAVRLGLSGVVDGSVLEVLLSGRHHVTGERLITAVGSSGRHLLKRGEHTRLVGGEPVWDLPDAAARLGLDPDELRVALATVPLDERHTVVDGTGDKLLTTEGIEALQARLGVPEREAHSEVGRRLRRLGAGARVTTAEAARLTGVSQRHLRKIIGEWHRHRASIEAGLEGRGLLHRRAWLPAQMVDGRWVIDVADLVAYWQRRQPPMVRQAYDVVATVEKSIAIVALLSDPAVRQRCLEALVAANNVGMDWLDQHASRGRREGSSVSSEGFVWASFMHATSRALDPHPHVHNLVMNFLEDPFGGRRAVDARFLYVEAKAASALATAQLRWELGCRLPGVAWVQHGRSPVWDLAGISAELIDEFSTRRSEIEAAVERFSKPDGTLPTRTELQEISKSTRRPKQVVEAATVLADWWERADRVGFDLAAVLGHAPGRAPPSPALTDEERVELFTFLAISPDGACQEESTFNRGDVLAAVNRWAPGGQPRLMPAATVVEVADDFLSTGLAVPVEHHGDLIRRSDGRPAGTVLQEDRWTTPDMVRTQLQVLGLWDRGLARGFLAGVPAGAVTQVGHAARLGAEQLDLVRAWSSSGDQFQAAIGQPGTGKTYTMRAARQVWEQHGWRVLGAAVKGTAAQHLARETGIRSETVAYYLAAASAGNSVLDARTVLVVDEATTVSDRDLRSLMSLCAESGAVLRMIGDPAQQQSVAAGGMWEHMVDLYRSRTPELATQRRLQDPAEVETARLVREGQIEAAFSSLLAAGKVRQADDPDDAEVLALAGWLERHQRGLCAPMIDRRNASRQRLNRLAQAIRVRAGEVHSLHRYGAVEIGVGDQVVATRPNRRRFPDGEPGRYLSNGSTGTVTAAGTGGITVRFDGLGDIRLPASEVRTHLDLGYALTAYSVQGLTLDEAEAMVRPGEEIHSLYVMLTRGRLSNTLIAARPLPSESHGGEARPDQLPVVEVAENVIDMKLRPAVVADDALADLVGTSGPAPGPAQPVTLLDQRRARADTARAVRHALNHPPEMFVRAFPAKPTTPWLARQWDAALAAVTEYRYRWRPDGQPGHTTHPLLGREPSPGTPQHHHWARVRAQIEHNAVTIALRHLQGAGYAPTTVTDGQEVDGEVLSEVNQLASPRVRAPSQWLDNYLCYHAGACTLGPGTDYPALVAWVNEVDAYRRQHSVTDTDTPLGPLPSSADAQTRWHALHAIAPLATSPVVGPVLHR